MQSSHNKPLLSTKADEATEPVESSTDPYIRTPKYKMSQEAWNRVDGAVRRRRKEGFSNRCNIQAYLLFYTKSMDDFELHRSMPMYHLTWNVVFISSYCQKGTKIFKRNINE